MLKKVELDFILKNPSWGFCIESFCKYFFLDGKSIRLSTIFSFRYLLKCLKNWNLKMTCLWKNTILGKVWLGQLFFKF